MTGAEKLDHARTVCAEAGVPLSMMNRLAVDVHTAGELLGDVSESTMKRLISKGELGAFKVGRSTRVEMTELLDFMERNRTSVKSRANPSMRAQAIALLDGSDV